MSVHAADAACTNGAEERDVRNHQSGGGTEDAEDVCFVFAIAAEKGGDDLHFIHEAFREEGADRAVRHTGRKDFLFRGATFAFEEAARNLSSRREAFAVFDGEGEEIDAFARSCGADADENDCVALADGDGTVGQQGHFSGFDLNFAPVAQVNRAIFNTHG